MLSWKMKAIVQSVLSVLPASQTWNRWFQRNITKSLELGEARFLEKWEQCARHLGVLSELRKPNPIIMELGTGWFPITPIGFALSGAKKVYSVDRQSLIDRDRVLKTLKFFERMSASDRLKLPSEGAERLRELLSHASRCSAEEMLSELGVSILVADARNIALPSSCIDAFTSNNTLEHIPRGIIAEIFGEFHRLGKPDAVMVHFIDLADHYAGFDPRINVFNFLRFEEKEWRWYNSDLHFQNRLRVNDYRSLHGDSGWVVEAEDNVSGTKEMLGRFDVAAEFQSYSADDLLVYKSWMISRKA